MNDTTGKEIRKSQTEDLSRKTSQREGSGTLRMLSYVILFMGAVFIVSAMETGSYRTPWPVAVLTAVSGIALYIYSRAR